MPSGQYPSGIVQPPMIYSYPPDPFNFLLPSVILWNPLLTFVHLFQENKMKCPHSGCSEMAVTNYWNDGAKPYRQPRSIHCAGENILLVSAVFICDDKHRTLAHDPRVLEMIPREMIPFALMHRTGFSRVFIDMVASFCHNGMNFHALEGSIGRMRWDNFIRRKSIYDSTVEEFKKSAQEQVECPEFASFETLQMTLLPSDNTISNCFLAQFLEDEMDYLQSIQSVDTGDSLSIDHTFKIATNIGYLRRDGKWVSQYDSVFFVMNLKGKIVSWQFTKGTSFEQVESLLA